MFNGQYFASLYKQMLGISNRGVGDMPNLVERSLMKFGDGGLVVSIPKPWATYYALKPGDKVEVITNGKMIVRPLKQRKDGVRRKS